MKSPLAAAIVLALIATSFLVACYLALRAKLKEVQRLRAEIEGESEEDDSDEETSEGLTRVTCSCGRELQVYAGRPAVCPVCGKQKKKRKGKKRARPAAASTPREHWPVIAAVKAHWAARAKNWWRQRGKGEVVCDKCMKPLANGAGFLKGGGYLLCEQCADAHLDGTFFDIYRKELKAVLGQTVPAGRIVSVLADQGGDIRNFLGE